MLSLRNDETLVIVVRRHWWTLTAPVIFFAFLLLAPAALSLAAPALPRLAEFLALPIAKFGAAIYFMLLSLFAFLLWMEYYLDVWIVTTRRIIDVDQRGLFHRVVSEIPLSRIQNVTIDINGILETLLKFGDVTIETAGELGDFTAVNVPLPYKIKDAILEHVHYEMEQDRPIVTTKQS